MPLTPTGHAAVRHHAIIRPHQTANKAAARQAAADVPARYRYGFIVGSLYICLLYTSDAADE